MLDTISTAKKSREEWLEERRKSIGERCGVSMSAVSLWETGKTVPRKRHWPVLEEMLNISEEQLLNSIKEGRKRNASGKDGAG